MTKTKRARLSHIDSIHELERLGLEPDDIIKAALNCGANVLVLADIDAPKKGCKLNEEDA